MFKVIARLSIASLIAATPLVVEAQKVAREALAITLGNGKDPFSPISDIEIGQDGFVYVLQPTEGLVRVFDNTGRYLRQVGRQGSGPGEFQFVGSAGLLGDTLTIWDPSQRRLSWFARDGTFLRSSLFSSAQYVLPLRSGGFIVQQGDGSSGVSLSMMDSGAPTTRLVASIDQSNRILAISSGGREFQVLQPFADFPLWAGSVLGKLAIVDRTPRNELPGRIHIKVFNGEGHETHGFAIPYEPIPLTRGTISSKINEMLLQFRAGFPQGFQNMISAQDIERALYKPTYLPAVSAVVISAEGDIWLRMANNPGASDSEWSILDETGKTKGTTRLPSNLEVRRVLDNSIWGVQVSDGEYTVHRYVAQ